MKLTVFSVNKKLVNEYRKTIKKYFAYNEKKPGIVVSLGGDGTFLMAERKYPGVPKLLIRDSNVCNKCDWGSLEPILNRLRTKRYRTVNYMKLVATAKGKRKVCVNEVTIRNKKQTHAIRFSVLIGRKKYRLIGDGVVIATPFGSTGYFYSITKRSFKRGIGIAFNNVTKKMNPVILPDNEKIIVKIQRGPALLSCDNGEDMISLSDGDPIRIKKSKNVARIIKFT